MLYTIRDLSDPLIRLIQDDPVRPEIPISDRINQWAAVYVLQDTQTFEAAAVVCVAFRDSVPSSVGELLVEPAAVPTTAVFYSIWSYRPGAGRRLITLAQRSIARDYDYITQWVTLSPSTEMARQFHLRNGASVFRVNSDSVNYLYSAPALE